jgi:hypothetical protein
MALFFGIILIVVAIISTLFSTGGVMDDDVNPVATAAFIGIVVEVVAGIFLIAAR